jgi:hypothetical protein
VRTSSTMMQRLRLRAEGDAPCLLQGDDLADVVADLEDLARRERQVDERLQTLAAAQDDSTPRGCPFDEAGTVRADDAYLDPEHL